jgi:hypothetical protein
MDESEWNRCSDPEPMLALLLPNEKALQRQLRSFAFGCCRRLWDTMPPEGRQLLEAVEAFAEGQVPRHERDAAVAAFRRVQGRFGSDTPLLRAVYGSKGTDSCVWTVRTVATNAAAATGVQGDRSVQSPGSIAERAAQAALLRDHFGPLPFRPVPIDAAWLAWNGGTVRQLAQAAYQERELPSGTLDVGRLGVLADALEEAGCTQAELLRHLRGPGPHVRGCWVIDLLSGREGRTP